MDLLHAVALGFIQGVAEWLPISSSAENILFMVGFLDFSPQAAFSFSVYLHFGTLLAALARFRRELLAAAKEFIDTGRSRLVFFIFTATVFSAFTGFPTYLFLKSSFLEYNGLFVMAFIGMLLVATGLVLYVSRKRAGWKTLEKSSWLEPTLAGLAQGIAALPGISRSGLTLAVMLLRGFRQEDALRLTFIISIPAVLGLILVETISGGFIALDYGAVVIGVGVSFVVGYLTIDLLIRLAGKVRFDFFCVLLGFFAVAAAVIQLLLK
ncbi:MAG: undecaprenyl-diphosphate phosphatase [Candidatus Altiarchaeota archaeon]